MAATKIIQERKQLNAEVGKRLAELRKLRNLTQIDLSRATDVPQSTISSIESGARGATPHQRAALAEALGVSLAMLDPLQVNSESYHAALKRTTELPPAGTASKVSARPITESGADLGSILPPGLEGFLERHRQGRKITRREEWYLTNTRLRTEPWVRLDDDFWLEMHEFWRNYLRKQDASGAGAAGTSRGRSEGEPSTPRHR
jgi:transcriptional regulator with XRE-family HTH domain